MWSTKKRKNKKKGLGRTKEFPVQPLAPIPYTLYPKKGFTLIELLIAASILGIIGLTILTTFSSGFQVYERVQTFSGVQADALLVLEEMERDLRNIFPMSTIAFVGDTQSMVFPAVIEKLETFDDEEKALSSIGKISYAFDSGTKELIRSEKDYSQAVAGDGGNEVQGNTLGFIEDIKFSYYSYNDEEQGFSWKDSWKTGDESSLVGVKIELAYQKEGRDAELVRTVFIPTDLAIKEEIVEEVEEEDDEDDEGGEGGGEEEVDPDGEGGGAGGEEAGGEQSGG